MNKKRIFLILIFILIVVLSFLLPKLLYKSNEEELNNNLKKLGSIYYEKFYYPSLSGSEEEVSSSLSRFKNMGITINLDNISRYKNIDKKLVKSMVNNKTKEKCSMKSSYVIIKPKKPYKIKDYTIEAHLDCGFDKK